MRIAVWHNLPSGGGKRALYDHVQGLLARGHYLEAWCPPTADREFLPLGDLISEHVVPLDIPQMSRRRRELTELLEDRRVDIDAMTRHCRVAASAMANGEFDVLLAGSCMFFRATAIGRLSTLPSVLYQQEPWRWLYEAMPKLPWLADERPRGWWHSPSALRSVKHQGMVTRSLRVQAREELRNASGFSALLVNSLFSRESILRAYGLEATVCYLGVDIEGFKTTSEPREPFLLTVGAGVREKNVDFLIRALSRRRGQPMPLIWVANWVDEHVVSRVHGLADELGVDLTMRVDVSDDELVSLLNRATALVYAPRLEPFGLAPLEAGACGLPVVAVAEGGVRETVVDGVTGLLVQANLDEFADAVDKVVADPDLASNLGKAGRRRVGSVFSLEAAAGRLEAQLLRTIEARASRAGGGRTSKLTGFA